MNYYEYVKLLHSFTFYNASNPLKAEVQLILNWLSRILRLIIFIISSSTIKRWGYSLIVSTPAMSATDAPNVGDFF